MLADSHAHLDMLDDAGAAMDRARAAGVGLALNPGADPAAVEKVLAAARIPGVWAGVGIHPEHQDCPLGAREILGWAARSGKVAAIGECGLDYHYAGFDKALQERLFREHIDAARESSLTLVIHSRDADEDMERILAAELGRGAFGFAMHCFAGGRRLGEFAVEHGGFLSASGIITYPSAEPLRGIFARAPADRLLVETDAPFLAPAPHRGERNEPAFTVFTARRLAEIRGVSFEEICARTTENFCRAFNIKNDPEQLSGHA
jgi:TatD DNase family protein